MAAAVVALSAVLAFVLAGRLTRPLNRLRDVTHELAAGSYEARSRIRRDDELGQLAHDVDTLAETLERHQRSRRQWIADIAHELRTPLAVMRAELEALEDGSIPTSNTEAIAFSDSSPAVSPRSMRCTVRTLRPLSAASCSCDHARFILRSRIMLGLAVVLTEAGNLRDPTRIAPRQFPASCPTGRDGQ